MAACRQVWLNNDSGILRKKEDEDELLVFGYSCKLFRDDEKALFIDQGKHLIPWMGDESLKIDRYDGRGALYDLKQCEAQPGGHDANRWVGLSGAERRVEQLCDEERYRALHHNEEEEALYQEEELKRLHKALGSKSYGEVAFNYDEDPGSGKLEEKGAGEPTEEEVEGGDEPFMAPPELDVPINMALPDSVKLNAIIEKTALFISQQGAQMEILLKMKQANNPQFQFLSFDSLLHPYYRHLLMAIKTGRYRPKTQEQDKEGDQGDGSDDHYLHPSLAPGTSRVELAPSIPSINYKPSADCAYSMLVNKIKNRQASFSVNPLQQPPAPGTSDPIPPIQYHQVVAPDHTIQASPVLYRHDPVSKEMSSPSATVYHHNSTRKMSHNGDSSDEDVCRRQAESVYSGGHSSSRSASPEMFAIPPPDMQLIIDKMASYVAKNGRDFEAIVRSKGDCRFAFLDVNHLFFPYYQHKVGVYEKLEVPAVASSVAPVSNTSGRMEVDESSQDMNVAAGAGEDSRDSSDKSSDGSRYENCKPRLKPAPVCFSIKKPKDSETLLLEKRNALPVEESSDEEEGQERDKDKVKVEEKKKVEENSFKEEKDVKDEIETVDLTESAPSAQPVAVNTTTVDENGSGKEKKGTADKAKWEERVKDKLAAAAREKIAAAAREKQLQLERKRRAAAFLNMIRKDHPLGAPDPPIIGPQLPDGAPVQRVSGDEGEVSSVPSPTSFSDVSSPQHIGNGSQELEDRLNPKQNGDAEPQTTSLYARIQASKQGVKRRNASSSSDSGSSSDRSTSSVKGQSHSHRIDKHRHKKKKIPGSHKKHKKEDEHLKPRKSKKKAHSRSRSRSKSHHSKSHHRSSEKSRSRSQSRSSKKVRHKKGKRGSRVSERRSSSGASSSS